MIDLPQLEGLDISGKKGLVRVDLDIAFEGKNGTSFDPVSDLRLKVIKPTVDFLFGRGASALFLIGHQGRPEGRKIAELSLKFLLSPLAKILEREVEFIEDFEASNISAWTAESLERKVFLFENLRFQKGEEANEPAFSQSLACLADFYVNEAFASSHRSHASIVGLPSLLPHAAGLRFREEVEKLSRVFIKPLRPVVFIVGGAKADKKEYVRSLEEVADKVLVGGRLPEFFGDQALESVRIVNKEGKIVLANLIQDKEDITLNSMTRFEEEIKKAGMIVLAGPMGKYEDEGHRQGTERIFRAVAENQAFKIAGGGDTLKVIQVLELENKFNWISVGGGAMLEFLAKKTLPGIEALKIGME